MHIIRPPAAASVTHLVWSAKRVRTGATTGPSILLPLSRKGSRKCEFCGQRTQKHADFTTSTTADLITACEVIGGRWALTLTGDRIDQPRASMHRHVSVIKDIADFDDRRDVRALILLLTLRSAPGLRPGKSRFRVITDGELIALASKAKDG